MADILTRRACARRVFRLEKALRDADIVGSIEKIMPAARQSSTPAKLIADAVGRGLVEGNHPTKLSALPAGGPKEASTGEDRGAVSSKKKLFEN
jgi:hypothetical protein